MVILIVEDEASSLVEIESIIKKRLPYDDIIIKSTSRARSAYEIAMKMHIDIFIIDIDLPDYDGLQLGQNIRSLRDYKYTPIIIESATLDDCYKSDVHQKINNIAYITKPYNKETFIEKLIDAIEISRSNSKQYVTINNKKSFFKYNIKNIVYIEKYGYSKKLALVWYEEGYGLHIDEFAYHLKQFKDLLNSNIIVQIHKSFMINPEFIYKIDLINNIITLKYTNIEIPIGSTYKESVQYLVN